MSRGILVANRGEVAVRVIDTAARLGLRTVAVHAEDDIDCLHVHRADEAVALAGSGPAPYLDAEQIVQAALRSGCDAVHPGWGFLSESPVLAERCAAAGLTFVGPSPDVLRTLGDKVAARAAAQAAGVPTARGTSSPAALSDLAGLLADAPHGIVVKAVGGGGGRGVRVVTDPADLAEAVESCQSEARSAFGSDQVYGEEYLPGCRHIEVQIAGDADGEVVTLMDRDCSAQRRHQKLVEIAPAPRIDPETRERMALAAQSLGTELGYQGLGTVEFLLADDGRFVFMEANPRLQVEHTVTEEILGLDLVALQLGIAQGSSIKEAGIGQQPARGLALQVRVNTETMLESGIARPATGTLHRFDLPHGRGVRVDTHGYTGYVVSPRYDPLLAKVIVHADDGQLATAIRMADRALSEFAIEGVQTNLAFLRQLIVHPGWEAGDITTTFVDDRARDLVAGVAAAEPDPRYPAGGLPRDAADAPAAADAPLPDGSVAVVAPMTGTVVRVVAEPDAEVRAGATLVVVEAMKMEQLVAAPVSGIVRQVLVQPGDTVADGRPMLVMDESAVVAAEHTQDTDADPDAIRPDLARVLDRRATTLDAARPDAVARRRARRRRTARENLEDLCTPGGISEYGGLALAAQRARRSVEELIERTPADGLVSGVGHVNSGLFPADRTACVVMSYDYTVLAGTQGYQSHRKKDRLFELAERRRLPVVVFAEGGGGRPGDTENPGVANLDCRAFAIFSRLSGLVPTVGVVTGHCFAGNAALLAACDVIIATPDANIGMAGPAMIEGGGLGSYRPEEIGPVSVQSANGVIDIVVADDAAAVDAARRYLSYFQGPLTDWSPPDQRRMRHLVPENRRRVYDVRAVIDTIADEGTVLELRAGFGAGIVTALVRLEGRPVGVLANNPAHLGGAIDADAADKAARFMELCDAYDIPLLSFCDTPGFMVGPRAEETGQVRHFGRMFVAGASLSIPVVTVVLRKAYGLGAQAMAGGGFFEPDLTLSWPTGEYGGMGLEGAVRLGFRQELDAIEDPVEREATYQRLVDQMYERGSALNVASVFEIDDVIDPAETRERVLAALRAAPVPPPRTDKKRPLVPAW